MTYPEAQRKAWTYIVLGYVLLAISVLIIATAIVKGIYYGCPSTERVCIAFNSNINWVYGHIFLVPWFWSWLPDATFNTWYLSLLSSAGLCALFFFLFAFYLISSGSQLRKLLNEAQREADKRAFSESYKPGNTQATGPINAGGDVKIEQIINSSPEMKKWSADFFKSPAGLVIIAAVGGVLTLYLGQLLGLSH